MLYHQLDAVARVSTHQPKALLTIACVTCGVKNHQVLRAANFGTGFIAHGCPDWVCWCAVQAQMVFHLRVRNGSGALGSSACKSLVFRLE